MREIGYRHQDEMTLSARSAEQVVPIILSAVGPVESVVDLGGGDGNWLREFKNNGVQEILLIDHPSAEHSLVINNSEFEPARLDIEFPAVRKCDLALCLECAEHLPPDQSEPLVRWLTSAASVVVFSAAIPGQGGKEHINEREPNYWADLFSDRGFVRHDVVRPSIIRNASIAWWYRQNIMIFSEPDYVIGAVGWGVPAEFELVHQQVIERLRSPSLRTVLRRFPAAVIESIRYRI